MEESKNLTSDGIEIKIGEEYYRQNGEIIIVTGVLPDIQKVIAYSYIKGEAIESRLYPNGHSEISCDYEYESEEFTLSFSQIYGKPPVFLIESSIKKKQEELNEIATKIGIAHIEMATIRKNNNETKRILESELSDLQEKINEAKLKIKEIITKLN
jgi:hypothetical protein